MTETVSVRPHPSLAAILARRPRERPPAPPRGGTPPVELRLAIGREGIGLELARPASLDCLTVTEASVAFPNVRFPLDVSGGVGKFRHRRGVLERLSFEVSLDALRRWSAPRLRGLLAPGAADVWVATTKHGATVGISGTADHAGPILAFDVVIDPSGADLRLVVVRARGLRLPAPATALAIRAVEGLLGDRAEREGASFRLPEAPERLARALFPEAGARAPSADDVVWTAVAPARDAWILHASRGAVPAEPSDAAALARELAALLRAADDARTLGDLEKARALDIAALERAPRHPEICARIAEIDAHVGGRAEAALATLTEAGGAAAHALLRAELLAEIGDVGGALAALERAADGEIVPSLAARAFARGAELVASRADQLAWLDRAVVRAPGAIDLRWQRVEARLAEGRLEDARADVEQIEALTSGSLLRYAVFWRAGKAWQKAGLVADAAPLFERALRFVPDEPEALAGLGRALIAQGKTSRGVALLARAVDLGGKHDAVLDLARALAGPLGDLPAAVARAHDIPPTAPEAPAARALEGRLRGELGDLAGASLAYARLRQHAEARVDDPRGGPELVPLLAEAATFERTARLDALAAQRHLAVALRLAPRDAAIAAAYREVGAAIANLPSSHETRAPEPLAASPSAPPATSAVLTPASPTHEGDDEAEVENLTRKLHANPADEGTAETLVVLLMRLARHHELLALLQTRVEDAPREKRAKWIPALRSTLEALEADARERGSDGEAGFYAEERARLDD